MIYFTSDTHFGHKNIIKFCNRPFANTLEMDEAIIANWNRVVGPADDVYHLGDLSFHQASFTEVILNRLNGRIHVIRGNHDKASRLKQFARLEWIKDYHELDLDQKVVLSHYAFRVWNKSHWGAWNLHGHSHGTLPSIGKQQDVGTDVFNYTPVSYDQLKEIMTKKTFEKVDHHDN